MFGFGIHDKKKCLDPAKDIPDPQNWVRYTVPVLNNVNYGTGTFSDKQHIDKQNM
jgi:hypothetical protein